jgi:uncharacterized protein
MIPIFPLPNVVLFPNVFLPLHIFEDRYRQMVGDALTGDRLIGMVLLREGWEHDEDSDLTPSVYPVGCSGLITHCERLDDGRFNIVLRGVEKFRILSEDCTLSYRRAEVEPISEAAVAAQGLCEERQRLERLLDERLTAAGSHSKVPRGMGDADLVNALSQYLEFEPLEKQALLEQDGVRARCRSLVDLLEMKSLLENGSFPQTTVQ